MRSSPRYEHELRRLMIDVRMAPAVAAEDTALVNELAALVNSVYAIAEEGLWADGTPRTTPARMAELIAAGQIAVARADKRIVGAVQIRRLDTGEGEFGMLVADPAHRSQGIGRELVRYAERWSHARGIDTMQLEVLVPRQWSQPSKEFLKAWYTRIGYRPVRTGQFEESYPELAPLLATPCDFVIYHKSLRTLAAREGRDMR
jgi:ribosomal protein S18 acetylase RimI-like enzyme